MTHFDMEQELESLDRNKANAGSLGCLIAATWIMVMFMLWIVMTRVENLAHRVEALEQRVQPTVDTTVKPR